MNPADVNKLNNNLTTTKIETEKLHHEMTRTELNRERHNSHAGTKRPKWVALASGLTEVFLPPGALMRQRGS